MAITTRTWREIKTWLEFEEEWQKTETEAGAVGLLYTGSKVQQSGHRTEEEFGHTDQARCFDAKVNFFLGACSSGNAMIETTARRLVVNQLLYDATRFSWTGLIESPHARLVEFLGTVHDDLRKQPFPRKAHEFLFRAFSKWRAVEREALAPPRRKLEFDLSRIAVFDCDGYNNTEPLVKACVAWGALPNVLVRQWFPQSMLKEIYAVASPLITSSLGETEDEQRARYKGSLTWAMGEDPPSDLYTEENRTELWKVNAITLHYLSSI